MTQSLKMSCNTSQRPLFLREKGFLTHKKGGKPPKIPGAVAYRGNLFQKKFTGKEQDQETGLYYYGARYLDPKTSRWLSGDPALGEYLPVAPLDDESKKHNQSLPGMGGVFNTVNLHAYHYAGNNPVIYIDPDGEDIILLNRSYGADKHGHNAVMVGNDYYGWTLFSKDGLFKNTTKYYHTYSDFQKENDMAKKKDKYDRAVLLQTTDEQDKAMKEHGYQIYDRWWWFEERTSKSGKTIQNCADLVADIIGKEDSVIITKPKVSKEIPVREKTLHTHITWPNKQFENFMRDNKNLHIIEWRY
jgi:RHS repeat-associated protein